MRAGKLRLRASLTWPQFGSMRRASRRQAGAARDDYERGQTSAVSRVGRADVEQEPAQHARRPEGPDADDEEGHDLQRS